MKKQKIIKTDTFLLLFQAFIEYHENATVVFDKRNWKTIRYYKNRYSIIEKWLTEKGLDNIKPEDFTITLARQYFDYLSQKYSHNYAVKLVETCKMVLQYAAFTETINYNPLQAYKVKRVGPSKPLFLTKDEIVKLENYTPTSLLKQKVKDMFLFQCYTGMDFGDTTSVSKENIVEHKGRQFIIKKRNKTNIESIIPYNEIAKQLFEKHKFNMNLLCNAVYNRWLKEVAKDLKITKHLTTHIGRKTYAMIKLNYEGYSIEGVSKMIGHKKISTTEDYYAQVEIDLISRELDRLGI